MPSQPKTEHEWLRKIIQKAGSDTALTDEEIKKGFKILATILLRK